MFFACLDPDDFGLDSFGKTGRDLGFEVAECELWGGSRKDGVKISLKAIKMCIMGVLFGQKANAGSVQSIKFVLFEKDLVLGDVVIEEPAPFNMRVAGCHVENSGHRGPLLVKFLVDKVEVGSGVSSRKVVGTRQRPEIAGTSTVISMDFERWVEAHHFGDKILDKLHVDVGGVFGQAKLRLDGVVLDGDFQIVKDGVVFVVFVIIVIIGGGTPVGGRGAEAG